MKDKEPKTKVDTTRRLSVKDFQTPGFDSQPVRLRTVEHKERIPHDLIVDTARDLDPDFTEDDDFSGEPDPMLLDMARDMLEPEYPEDIEAERPKEQYIEGATFTDNFHQVGFTYSLQDSSIQIKNIKNELLYKGFIYTPEEFEKALKKADKKQDRLNQKN